ncbi:uncharacterized protein LOC130435436 [Triplophysa dalaica]|uniref:uncharacterized protein LOC130435436 n=1 Tax=Triplophysa dalaica TaxID=1582913 RepID=UPI0024DFB435|nr:uncharacterized protein LOC130435436 [Triplophysa dalaica]
MRRNINTSRLILLSVLCIATSLSQSTTECNSTHANGSCSLTNVTTGYCDTNNLKNFTSLILNAVDNATHQLQCVSTNNASFPQEKLHVLPYELGKIITSTLNVLVHLGASSIENIAKSFGALHTLTVDNAQNVEFVQSWLCVRLVPILPYITKEFLSNMSKINFSCVTYQKIVQTLNQQVHVVNETIKPYIYSNFIRSFLSRELSDAGCLSQTAISADWLEQNFGKFSKYATLEDLRTLNGNFSSFGSLDLLTPTQVAELTRSSGALNNTDQINAVFDRLEVGHAFQNVDEFLTTLAAAPEVSSAIPTAVRDVMMNRTYGIVRPLFQEFVTEDWVVWFTLKLTPILSSFTADMLVTVTADINCTNYRVIVKGLGMVLSEMTALRIHEITQVLVEYLKDFATQFNTPACGQNAQRDAQWLNINLGRFSTAASYSDLKDLNVTVLPSLESLSLGQKAELLLDPSTGALENEAVVKEVLGSILETTDDTQLKQFFEAFVEVTKEENVTYIKSTAVRDTMLNMTLTALASEFSTFQTSDYKLWFQVNLVVLLASFQPSLLVVIPTNISCDSYDAVLQGLEIALALLPSGLQEELKSSIDILRESPPDGCSPPDPVPVCKETVANEESVCKGLQGGPTVSGGDPCALPIPKYACSSAMTLSSADLATLLSCELVGSKHYPVEMWKLFFKKSKGVLGDALSTNSNKTFAITQSATHALDAIGEVMVYDFDVAQLSDADFVDGWFTEKLRPLLPAISGDLLSCLSSKNFTCDTYQVVVDALGAQSLLMGVELRKAVVNKFIVPFLSRGDLADAGCLSQTASSADWLEQNFGKFSKYATLEDLRTLNGNFSSFGSLDLLTPTQVAELTRSSGALNNTDQINAVFDRLEVGHAFQNVDEFLTTLAAAPEVSSAIPTAVRDVMMNRTYGIVRPLFQEFVTEDWVVWFTLKLTPILSSFTADMLVTVTADINCTNYRVIVKGLGMVLSEMTALRIHEITQVLVEYLKDFATQFNTPACGQNAQRDAQWLNINLGRFSTAASYSDLKDLNVTVLASLESLSLGQKAELLLDPSTGALENEAVVKEVLGSILETTDDTQLKQFFEAFVEVTKEENVTYIKSTAVRDTMLNMTLTALASEFSTFQTSDYKLWFQVNLVVLLASFQPSLLVVIPTNISCDSYDAVLQGLEIALALLPSGLQEELKSSIDILRESPPDGCSPPDPVPVCKETVANEESLCKGLQGGPTVSGGDPCALPIPKYACSSAMTLSSADLATLLSCELVGSKHYPVEMWKLFFKKSKGVLGDALSTNSNKTFAITQSATHALDAIGEVMVYDFDVAQLSDADFVDGWFTEKLRPLLPAISGDLLSCLSSKNFTCDTYQVVVDALGAQSLLMGVELRKAVVNKFIVPFLSRGDLADAGCLSQTASSADWLEQNFGKFSKYATLEDLRTLNGNFSSFGSLDLLTPTQVAELTRSSGALNNTDQINAVFDRLEVGHAFQNVDEFLTTLAAAPEVSSAIPTAVRDVMMNRTYGIVRPLFQEFVTEDWVVWFTLKLTPILSSFTADMLVTVTADINCTNYRVIVKGLGMVLSEMTALRIHEITQVLVEYLKDFATQFNTPACGQNAQRDAQWLNINLGRFSTAASYSDLKDLNVTLLASLESLSLGQKAELLLDPSTGALENEAVVKEVLGSILETTDDTQLKQFFEAFVEVTKEENVTYIKSTAVRDTMLNMTLTALASEFSTFQTSDYKLWFQVNLVVLLASFQPSLLVVIPTNISCDSYDAVLQGLEIALALLPSGLQEELKSSIDILRESPPDGCSPPDPVPVCKETVANEESLCKGLQGGPTVSGGDPCALPIPKYACSSAMTLSSADLATLLSCELVGSKHYPVEMWKLFFKKSKGVLGDALSTNSNKTFAITQSATHALDAIGEVMVYDFDVAQLSDADFVDGWFTEKLRPLLPAISGDLLSCLSSKNFTCDTYQVVVDALGAQSLLMGVELRKAVVNKFIVPFLSRGDLADAGCLSQTASSADWLEQNFGKFSKYATLEDLRTLNGNFSSFGSLDLLTPTQVAELTRSSGALNNTDQINAVFDRLEVGHAFQNVDEFLTTLAAAPEVSSAIPTAVRDVMMNRTYGIVRPLFQEFVTEDWVVWFTLKLTPILSSFTADMLVTVTADINCTNYRVIVKGLGMVLSEMTALRIHEITQVLVEYLKDFATQFNTPACGQNAQRDAQWLNINLGRFSTAASYSDLKDLNVTVLASLESLSLGQKAELLLDPSTGALENEAVVKEVLGSILETTDDTQLKQFFEAFVEVTKEENVTYIKSTAVRDTMLNMTLTALASEFSTFQTSDYKLWFQVNLVVLLASFQPSLLVVIPTNISCDSYDAVLQGLEIALALLPSGLQEELKSSIDILRESPPDGCSPPDPVPVCKETVANEESLCKGLQGGPTVSGGDPCAFPIPKYACSSAMTLSSADLATLLSCELVGSKHYPVEMWKLFFKKSKGVLGDALSTNSNKTFAITQSATHALDAIGEVMVYDFDVAQLSDADFVDGWFTEKLRPLLPAISGDLLSCLSSKNFTCDTYQVVVDALGAQSLLMGVELRKAVVNKFIVPFLSRGDLADAGCLSQTASSADWLEQNFGKFSKYATLEDLRTLNGNFSSFGSLDLLTPTQVAELTRSSGALNNTDQINAVFDRLEVGHAFQNVDEFLTTLAAATEVSSAIPTAVRDVMMNRTYGIVRPLFQEFVTEDWVVWFTLKLTPILSSFTADMLVTVTADINCTNYRVIVKGLGMVLSEMTALRIHEITQVLVEYLKDFATQFNTPACGQNAQRDAQWLNINLGRFSTAASYSDLKDLNVTVLASLESLSLGQKAELLLDPSTGALENEAVVKEVLGSILETTDDTQLKQFFEAFVEVTKEENVTYIKSTAVRDTMLNMTLTALASEFSTFQTSDYKLWFQVNLVVLLASFQPSLLVVIPTNISCDSYDAVLQGLEIALALLPSGLQEELKSSIDILRESPPDGCSPPDPVPVCKETVANEESLCKGLQGGPTVSGGDPCALPIPKYACSSAMTLSSADLATLLSCELVGSKHYPVEMWKLFFKKSKGVLGDALSTNSNKTFAITQSATHALDAIGEVMVYDFDVAQLSDADFVDGWFTEKLRPLLPAISGDLLSCLSSKNFTCDTYQVVVDALGAQSLLMGVELRKAVVNKFIVPFLSRGDLADAGCLSQTASSADWLEQNFGKFSKYATLEDLRTLNGNFSSFGSLDLLTPTQVAELTRSSGALNNTDQINAVFDRLEVGHAFQNVDEFLTTLAAAPEVSSAIPTAVRDVMMNRTYGIVRPLFQEFVTEDWVVWFTLKLTPILSSFTADMLVTVTADINCTNYRVIVKGLGMVLSEMTALRIHEITQVLVEYLKDFATQFNTPACGQNAQRDAQWLNINLGRFSTAASYSDLKDLNVTVLASLESLSLGQKAELLLDPSTGALENEAVVKEVLGSILETTDDTQLKQFFEAFVEVTKEENVTYIKSTAVRDTMLNMTLTALASEFSTFQTSDYKLWFQVNLVVLLASFQPSLLVVIPTNISCDSYDAVLQGLEIALALLPSGLQEELKSSIDILRESPPDGCSPPDPVPVCKETVANEESLCKGLQGGPTVSGGDPCALPIPKYACSSAMTLSSADLATLLSCELVGSKHYPVEMWKLFFKKSKGVLGDALSTNSNKTFAITQSATHALDAIGEVMVYDFDVAQLSDADFVDGWFTEKLRPLLPAISGDLLSCLSSKNFTCDTYQVVVDALGAQSLLMGVELRKAVVNKFIVPFLSRGDLADAGCLSQTASSADWLEQNFGKFSKYATLEDLRTLNGNFSSFGSLDLLTPTQVAELTRSSGALNNTDQINAVFDRLEVGHAFQNVDEFLTTLAAAPEVSSAIPTAVRDVMMNRTYGIVRPLFQEFVTEDWVVWFTLKLTPILSSFTADMLVTVTADINCTNYRVIVKGLGMVLSEMTALRIHEITQVLVEYLKDFATQFNTPACGQNAQRDAQWLNINLGRFSTAASYSDLKDLNVTVLASLESLSLGQKAELLLDPSTGALENEAVVKEVLGSILETTDDTQLKQFFEAFVEVTKEENVTYIKSTAVRDTMLNMTLTALASEFSTFQTSDYKLWFQVNLVVLLASFQPSLLVVIPTNISCDSYDAVLQGLEIALALLPSGLQEELKSSIDILRESPPDGCSPPDPVPVCKETVANEESLCKGLQGGPTVSGGDPCALPIPKYACSSAMTLSSADLATLLSCELVGSKHYPVEMWKLFFKKSKGVLGDALSTNSNKTFAITQSATHALDAIGEVMVYDFDVAQLSDADFVDGWFTEKLRPLLPAISGDLLSCLSSKNFTCDTYQVVVDALGAQSLLMGVELRKAVVNKFIVPFLSRGDLADAGCLSQTASSADWLEQNFGKFSKYATLEDLRTLNGNFSSFGSLDLLTPTQVAELTRSSGALNNTDQINAVFDRLEVGHAFQNVDEFLTTLAAATEVSSAIPTAVRDVMMNRTYGIVRPLFQEFVTEDWVVWFTLKLTPILSSFTADMLVTVTADINCTNYRVIVKGLGMVLSEMTALRIHEITQVLVEYLKDFATQFNTPACGQNAQRDAQWLNINLGRFSTAASYSDLKDLNVTVLASLESLSLGQKAELLLDPSTGALENEAVVKEVLGSILETTDDTQLKQFFEAFVEVTKEENVTYIKSTAVRDTMLNMTLTALASEFSTFQTSDYKLWFQVNLVVLLASFQPSLLVVIPTNISCDSYDAVLQGLEIALALLPSGLQEELKSSIDILRESPPDGCSPPDLVPVCKETVANEESLCKGLQGGPTVSGGDPCALPIPKYACSSAMTLSSADLATLLSCELVGSKHYPVEMWKLFFKKSKGVLGDALSTNSNKTFAITQSATHALDAIGEVMVYDFDVAQLSDADFVDGWFTEKLRPLLPAISGDLLSCLSSKNFTCDTYQVVVDALGAQSLLMGVELRKAVVNKFIVPFLSRGDLADAGCLSQTASSADWLEQNFGKFSKYATLEDLRTLNGNFSSFGSLDLLTPTQVAELTRSSGALNNTDQINAVFDRLEVGHAFQNVDEFLTTLAAAPEVSSAIPTAVRDVMMNRTYGIVRPLFQEFVTEDWVVWFTLKLTPILSSFTADMLVTVTADINCTNYRVIVKGLGMVLSEMTALRIHEITQVLVEYLKDFATQFNTPACGQNAQRDAQWLNINLGRFSTAASYSDLKDLNVTVLASLESLSLGQKAELLLDPSTGALENEAVVKEVLGSILETTDDTQLKQFFEAFVEVTKEENVTYIKSTAVRDTMLNMTLTALASEFSTFQTSDYKLWFQVNLVVLLASFQPSLLVVIPTNISCDSYDAVLQGLEIALALLPSGLQEELKSSIDILRESPPDGCSPPDPVPVCKETVANEESLCKGLQGGPTVSGGDPCALPIPKYACSSAMTLSSADLATLLSCELVGSKHYPVEMWKLFFKKSKGVLGDALSTNSNKTFAITQSATHALDAIGEVMVYDFDVAQLSDADFVDGWFTEKLRPLLPAISGDLLSCLSSKNFTCDTYQVVVDALGAQSLLMGVELRKAVVNKFIVPFLSRGDLADAGCLSQTASSADWLEQNFGKFSKYATLEDLRTLNGNFSSFGSLDLLTPTQVAELTRSSGALNNTDQINAVFDRLEVGHAFQNVDEFLTTLAAAPEVSSAIPTAVRDVMMNRTYGIVRPLFQEFVPEDWVVWFTLKLTPILSSFTADMLVTVTADINCTNYRVIVKGLGMVLSEMTALRIHEITQVLVEYLKDFATQFNTPACGQNAQRDAQWLNINLGRFSTAASYSDLKDLNVTVLASLESLSLGQKAELLLDPSTGALENEAVVEEVLGIILESTDETQLKKFFEVFVEVTKERNVSSLNSVLRSIVLNMTLTALEIRFETFSRQNFTLWFQTYLHLFLPGMNAESLSVIPRTISCDSYREIVKGCDNVFSSLTLLQSEDVYSFIKNYLSHQTSQGQSCVLSVNNDSDWVQKNFGQFSTFATFTDFITFNKDFNGVEAAEVLTVSQLVELCSSPSQLHGAQDVQTVMRAVKPEQLSNFFNVLSLNIQKNEQNYSQEVKQAFLQVGLDRADLSSPSLTDSEVLIWLTVRLRPLLSVLTSANVNMYFDIIRSRSCSCVQEAVNVLDAQRSNLNEDIKRQIYDNIQLSLKDAPPLRCYDGRSFYVFLKNTFLHFGFPDVNGFLSLIPVGRRYQVLSSVSTVELREFLNSTPTLINGSGLCDLLQQYNQTTLYMETEPVGSEVLGRQVLSCVWSQVLRVENRSEVDQWFDQRLVRYLPFLTAQFIFPTQFSGASCLSYTKLVSVLGNNFNFNSTDFTPADVYSSIKNYLTNGGSPRCFDPSDPQLNSTNWFVRSIGTFVSYLTLTDLNSFVSSNQIGVFLENQENLQLFNRTAEIKQDIIEYYTTQLYTMSPYFNPIKLPKRFLCDVPSSAFENLGERDSMTLIQSINMVCNGSENLEITAALTANLPSITSASIQLLGSQSVGLSEAQIISAPPQAIKSALPTLSTVTGWNQGQANAIVQTLTESGFSISSGSSLLSLGTLVKGVQSDVISSISSAELLTVSTNPTFITNIIAAPSIVQDVYVMKLVSIDETKVVQNVPDMLASSIPRVFLVSQSSVNLTLINKKHWTHDQAVMLFGSVAEVSENTEELSESLLQGFTCTSAQTLSEQKVKQLVKACRHRPGRQKIQLRESQLTCMYNHLKKEVSPTFTDLPPDMLLYYSYEKVEKTNCRSFFRAMGKADFTIPSSILNKKTTLFNNARSCLDISGQSLSGEHVELLGNLTCTLEPEYIQNSHPIIIESLKTCSDLSDAQISAVETLLLFGNTTYGESSSWDQQTLDHLGVLPLYFSDSFWRRFSATVKRRYLKVFMPLLKDRNTEKHKLKKLFKNCNAELETRSRMIRSADCSLGNVTEAIIADASFPFGYTAAQFDACLDFTILKSNLAAVTDKVDDSDFQRIILNKLKQVYPEGLDDSVLTVLAAVSRQATVDEIRSWNITKIDTLTALMDRRYGEWDREKSKEVILRYLSVDSHTLGTNELNAVLSNICTLDVSTLQSITADSLRNANVPDLSSCTFEQKSVVYTTARSSFSTKRVNQPAYSHLISPFLGGASAQDIKALASENITIDINTFRSLAIPVVKSLNVADARALMGVAVADLKLFENDSVVQAWITSQRQSQLDVLNLNLQGGLADSPTTKPISFKPTNSPPDGITQSTSQSSSSTPHGSASALKVTSGVWFIASCVWFLNSCDT